MATIRVVENPRRKKRRRYTAKQRAAGFGGRRTRRARPTAKRRRRRNPMLASLGNPRRRRRRSSPRRRPRYTVTGVARRRRRNPRLGLFNINLASAAWVGAGVLSVEMLPRIGRRFWPGLPASGPLGHLVKAAAAVGAGILIGKVTNRHNGSLVTAGGLSIVLVDLFRQYAAPHLPFLSGLGNDTATVSDQELRDIYGIGAYVETPAGMGAYVESPVGAYG